MRWTQNISPPSWPCFSFHLFFFAAQFFNMQQSAQNNNLRKLLFSVKNEINVFRTLKVTFSKIMIYEKCRFLKLIRQIRFFKLVILRVLLLLGHAHFLSKQTFFLIKKNRTS